MTTYHRNGTAPGGGTYRLRPPGEGDDDARVDHGSAPSVPCATCGLEAGRVLSGVGRDLHECRACGGWTSRWHCCGWASVHEPATTVYRAEAKCPGCGKDRFGEQVRPNLIGTREHDDETDGL